MRIRLGWPAVATHAAERSRAASQHHQSYASWTPWELPRFANALTGSGTYVGIVMMAYGFADKSLAYQAGTLTARMQKAQTCAKRLAAAWKITEVRRYRQSPSECIFCVAAAYYQRGDFRRGGINIIFVRCSSSSSSIKV